jgi:uncharacterized protein
VANLLAWFEIPVNDIERAAKFYSAVLGYPTLQHMDFGGFKMAFFPADGTGLMGGALCQGKGYKPSADGALVYFSVNPDLNEALSKVEAAGGKVVASKKIITEEYGYMAIFNDSEGNKIALHSQK